METPSYPIPRSCPTCGDRTEISEVSCVACGTQMRNRFQACRFCALSEESQRFITLFVLCRGNIKQMERESSLGYWTIRSRLDELIGELSAQERSAGASHAPLDPRTRRRLILEEVKNGDLDPAEAEKLLGALD